MKTNEVKKTIGQTIKEQLSNEITNIEEKKYIDIDWYNLKNEVEKIKHNCTDKEEEILLYEFQKKFINENKSLINGYDKDIVILKVLEELILKDGENIGASQLKEKSYYINSGVNNAVVKALAILELYEVVDKQVVGENNKKGYSLNLDKWFKNSRYKIQDYVVLEKLAPIISSYINIGFIDIFNIEKLFDRLSNIIEYAILPSTLHNKYLDIENVITTAIIDNEELEIDIKKNDKTQNVEIKPIKIIFKKGSKFIVYIDIKSNTKEEVEIYKCSLDFELVNPNISMLGTNDILKEEPKTENINLLLECDSVVYEYFNMIPLSNMIIYDSEDKLKEFANKYNYDYLPNKFYIEAKDNKEKIISVIFHCIDNVKVLTPTELNEEIINRMKKFVDKTNIDICKDNNNTPNNGNEKDNKKSFNEDVREEKNKENIKSDIIDKIKNKDNTDFNF